MIVVRVELHSAVTGRVSELARLLIDNDGIASSDNPRVGDYRARSLRGRDKDALSKGTVSKTGYIKGWRRLDFHVWNLVRRALEELGYDKGPKA